MWPTFFGILGIVKGCSCLTQSRISNLSLSEKEPQTAVLEACISVCIVCRNEADKLGPCLESVGWADEILVMDLSSEDDSAIVAQRYGAQIVQREPFPIVEPLRNEIAVAATYDWILALDPDERVTPGLAHALKELAQRDELDAIVIPRMNYDLGYPPSNPIQRYEPQLRMYRRTRVRWPDVPNTLPSVPDDRKFYLPQSDDVVIIHDRSRNVPEILERVIRYAPMQAQSMLDQGQRFSASAMLSALASQMDKEFFRAEAWKDGLPGVLRATILVGYKFYVWTAFWQLSGAQRTQEDDRLIRRLGAALDLGWRFWRTVGSVSRFLRRLGGGKRKS
jgi:glycosyltransferase involved in cell wall biosynthesis